MIDFIASTHNLPFFIAIGLAVGVGMAELLMIIIGGGSELLGDILPDFLGHLGIESPGELTDGGSITEKVLGFFYVGDIPMTMLLCLGLMSFGCGGLIVQTLALEYRGELIPWWVILWPMLMVMLVGVKLGGSVIRLIIPRDETQAVSDESFAGMQGQLLSGTARPGAPAQALFKDKYGHPHYLMVEPADGQSTFPPGSCVKIITHKGTFYQVEACPQAPTPAPAPEEEK